MRERTRTLASIDEGAIAVFLDGLVGMTPRDMAHRARALAVVVRDAPCPVVDHQSADHAARA